MTPTSAVAGRSVISLDGRWEIAEGSMGAVPAGFEHRVPVPGLLNGVLLGEHLPSFTPGYFDARPALRGSGAENELVERVGATREALPATVTSGVRGGAAFLRTRLFGVGDEGVSGSDSWREAAIGAARQGKTSCVGEWRRTRLLP